MLSAVCCYLIFSLGKHIVNEWNGLIGAFIFALYPAAIHLSVKKIQYTILIVVLLLLFV